MAKNDIKEIFILHQCAIGDAVLATPVSLTMKANFPQARITYLTHKSLVPLLSLCQSIDYFIEGGKEISITTLRSQIAKIKPDLIIDLSTSLRSFCQTVALAPKILRYCKEQPAKSPTKHAVDNFLETLLPLHLPKSIKPFPSLTIDYTSSEKIKHLLSPGIASISHANATTRMLEKKSQNLFAFVPGVGLHRAHRRWPERHWIELIKYVDSNLSGKVVLVGGKEEVDLCKYIESQTNHTCLNMAGKITLPETAALLSLCQATVSGDTGPAHISAAVGTPVIGLYGPTYPERSGPYGYLSYGVDNSASCLCSNLKKCRFVERLEPGTCMTQISPKQVITKLIEFLAESFS